MSKDKKLFIYFENHLRELYFYTMFELKFIKDVLNI